MLRMIFVTLVIMAGIFFAVQSAFFGLLFYLWNAYFRPEDWTYGDTILTLKLSWIIGLYVVIRTAFSMPSLKINVRTVLIALFLVQAIIGTITSEHQAWSYAYLMDFLKVLVITYLIVVLVDDRRQFRLTLVVIALSLAFEAAKQGWAYLILNPTGVNNNANRFLGDNNGVALGMMMLLPVLGALVHTSKWRWEPWIYRILAIGVFYRGMTTYSRGGFLAAAVLGLMVFLRSEKKMRAAVAVLVFGLLVWTVMPQAFWDRMQTITATSEDARDESAAGRLYMWNVAMVMAQAKPLTGVGLNGFQQSQETYDPNSPFGTGRAAHSIWFGVLGDLGWPGLFLFIANLGMALWSAWRVVRMTRKRPELRELRIYGNALVSSLVVYAVAGTFLSHHYNEMAWHMFGLSTALYLITTNEVSAGGPALERAATS